MVDGPSGAGDEPARPAAPPAAPRAAGVPVELARAVLDATVEGILVVGVDGLVVGTNPSAEAMFGVAPGGLVGRSVHDLVPDEARGRHVEHVASFRGHDARIMGRGRELGGRRADGTVFPLEVTLTPLAGADRPLVCAVVRDITERVEMNQRLMFLSLHDSLTGLGNRAQLDDRLRQGLARCARRGGRIAVLLLDLDRFKAVNDSLGHASGDHLLRQVAARMLGAVRPEDSVVRLGGDEFVVMCEVQTEEQGRLIAERIQDRLDEPFLVGRVEVFVGASIGVAVSAADLRRPGPDDDDPAADREADREAAYDVAHDAPERLLGDADLALYAAKGGGRGRVRVYEPQMRAAAEGRLSLASDLHRALEREEVGVTFDPMVDVTSGQVVAVRARSRWDHPRVGVVTSAQIRGLAEDSDLLVALDVRTLTLACSAARAAQDTTGRAVETWVDLSTRALASPGLVESVRLALSRSGLDAQRLVVEVDEATLGHDAPAVEASLRALRSLGAGIAVDELGAGSTRLAGLVRSPLTALELSAVLVDGLADDPAVHALVEAVAGLGQRLGLATVACGVRTPAQLDAVRRIGVTRATGPLWGAAVPPERLAVLLAGDPPSAGCGTGGDGGDPPRRAPLSASG